MPKTTHKIVPLESFHQQMYQMRQDILAAMDFYIGKRIENLEQAVTVLAHQISDLRYAPKK